MIFYKTEVLYRYSLPQKRSMTDSKSKPALYISYVLQGIVAFFFLAGAINNMIKSEEAIANAQSLGYTEGSLFPLACVLLVAVICYLIPRFSILGAILLTTWLGGAVATHVIHRDNPLIVSLPVIFATFVWIAIALRDKRVQSIFSIK